MALMKARVGKAIPKDRAAPSAGRDRSAPRQQTPKNCQRARGLASGMNNSPTTIKKAIQVKAMKISVSPLQVNPPGSQDAAIATRSPLIADSLKSGESAFDTRKCQSQ